MKEVTLYTDGACRGNPGPGGWGAILNFAGREKELFGGENPTTNKCSGDGLKVTVAIQETNGQIF